MRSRMTSSRVMRSKMTSSTPNNRRRPPRRPRPSPDEAHSDRTTRHGERQSCPLPPAPSPFHHQHSPTLSSLAEQPPPAPPLPPRRPSTTNHAVQVHDGCGRPACDVRRAGAGGSQGAVPMSLLHASREPACGRHPANDSVLGADWTITQSPVPPPKIPPAPPPHLPRLS